MRIKLLHTLPIQSKYNMVEGRELEVLEEERQAPIASQSVKQSGRLIGYWVNDNGTTILVLQGEAEVINA